MRTSLSPLFEQFPYLILNDKLEETASEARELCNFSEGVKSKLKELEFVQFWFELNTFKNTANEKIFCNLYEIVFNIFLLHDMMHKLLECFNIQTLTTN